MNPPLKSPPTPLFQRGKIPLIFPLYPVRNFASNGVYQRGIEGDFIKGERGGLDFFLDRFL